LRFRIVILEGKTVNRRDARWCDSVIRIDTWTSARIRDRKTSSLYCRSPLSDASLSYPATCTSCRNQCRYSGPASCKSLCTPEPCGSYQRVSKNHALLMANRTCSRTTRIPCPLGRYWGPSSPASTGHRISAVGPPLQQENRASTIRCCL